MSDYIKREDAKRVLNNGLRYMRAFGVNRCLTMIDEIPPADVVEVVRCKDCKWYHGIGCSINIVDESDEPKDNDYCSMAERRTDE